MKVAAVALAALLSSTNLVIARSLNGHNLGLRANFANGKAAFRNNGVGAAKHAASKIKGNTTVANASAKAKAVASATDSSGTAAAAATSTNDGNNNGNNGNSTGNNGNNNGNSDNPLLLLASNVNSNAQQTGLGLNTTGTGDSASETDAANFINVCTGKTITNGLQVKTGSCNGITMGDIPSTNNMVGCQFSFPANLQTIAANQNFTIVMKLNNLAAGVFTNAAANYYAAPQSVNNAGQIVGHTHVVIEPMTSFTDPNPLDPLGFTYFKGVVTGQDGNGNIKQDVVGGVPEGFYRLSSINTAANHQPVLMPVAQHGSTDCQIFFQATEGDTSSGAAASATTAATGGKNASVGADAAASASTAATGGKNASVGADAAASSAAAASTTAKNRGKGAAAKAVVSSAKAGNTNTARTDKNTAGKVAETAAKSIPKKVAGKKRASRVTVVR